MESIPARKPKTSTSTSARSMTLSSLSSSLLLTSSSSLLGDFGSLDVDPAMAVSTGSLRAAGQSLEGNSNKSVDNDATSNKLTSRLGQHLYGRDDEIKTLRAAYHRARDGRSEVVFVSGTSGSGKSRLVELALREYTVDRDRALYASGKFDPLRSTSPFSAVMEAFQDIVDLMATSEGDEDSDLDSIRSAIDAELGEDVRVLGRVIDNLGKLTKSTERRRNWRGRISDPYEPSLGYRSKSFTRLQLHCQTFLRLVCSSTRRPIVMVLDDLQWADEASQELIRALLSDPRCIHVLFVCCYRDDVAPTSLVGSHFRQDGQASLGLNETSIQLGPLNLTAINELLSGETGNYSKATWPLAEVIFKKTSGNALFVSEYLRAIESEGYLYETIDGTWKWDLPSIQYDTNVPDSIGELLVSKICKLSEPTQRVLRLAAFLGCRFELDFLEKIVQYESSESRFGINSFQAQVENTMADATRQGFVETYGNGYKFSHDRVREVLYSMTEDGDREAIHRNIGHLMTGHAMEPDTPVRDLLQATYHFNLGRRQLSDPLKRVELARINLEAGRIVSSRSSFIMARQHFLIGLELIGEHGWDRHYHLTMDLSLSLAENQFCTKDDHLVTTVENILDHAKTLVERIKAYFVLVDYLTARGRFQAAVDLGFKVLKELREPVPTSATSFHVLFELVAAQLIVKEMTDDDFLRLPVCMDPMVETKMKMLITVGCSAYLSGQGSAVIGLRMIRLLCRFGLTKWAPLALAYYGAVMGHLGNRDENFRFGQLALRMLKLKRIDTRAAEARTLVSVALMTNHWRRPIQEGTPYLQRAYKIGMKVGDLGYALFAAVGLLSTAIHTGVPLPEVERIAREQVHSFRTFDHDNLLHISIPILQYILKMRGSDTTNARPAILEGEAIANFHGFLDCVTEQRNNTAACNSLYFQLRLSFFFEDWKKVKKVLDTIDRKTKRRTLHWSCYTDVFDRGIIFFALYRESGNPQHRRQAQSYLAKLERWVGEGVSNCHGMMKLLKAEDLVRSGDTSVVVAHYNAAIGSFSATHALHHWALALERTSRFLLDRQAEAEACRYMREAINVYERWGASSRISWLQRKFADLIRDDRGERSRNRPNFVPREDKEDTVTVSQIDCSRKTRTHG